MTKPDDIKNAAAAYGLAATVQATWQQVLSRFIMVSGLFTDELQASDRGGLESLATASSDVLLDARIFTNLSTSQNSPALHNVRGYARQAIGSLAKYAGDSSRARRGALYAYMGYAEILLADLYCSGVPLSTWDFEADYTYRPSSNTKEVYQHAIALFDTASILAADSLPVVNLARVGKGRALLAIGEFSEAARAVDSVTPGFVYSEPIYTCGTVGVLCGTVSGMPSALIDFGLASVPDGEGGTRAILHTDPRTAAVSIGTGFYGYPVYFPSKYEREAVNDFVVASETEAKLIRAEAALRSNDIQRWLMILNELRANSPITAGLPALEDPGANARMDTLFAERGRWLFLTGHRQGDLRRWLRQDLLRTQQTVYPSGVYPGSIGRYGTDITMPIDDRERANPYFKGCLNRSA